jgi:hypothetical protein
VVLLMFQLPRRWIYCKESLYWRSRCSRWLRMQTVIGTEMSILWN